MWEWFYIKRTASFQSIANLQNVIPMKMFSQINELQWILAIYGKCNSTITGISDIADILSNKDRIFLLCGVTQLYQCTGKSKHKNPFYTTEMKES